MYLIQKKKPSNTFISDNGLEFQFFVGASDLEIEGVWKWITPSSMNYFNFKTPFQPDNDDDKFKSFPANCAVLYSQGTFRRKGLLVDVYCDQEKSFICEI